MTNSIYVFPCLVYLPKCGVKQGRTQEGGGDGGYSPPPLGRHNIVNFSVIVTKKSNRGPLKITLTKSEFLFFGVG